MAAGAAAGSGSQRAGSLRGLKAESTASKPKAKAEGHVLSFHLLENMYDFSLIGFKGNLSLQDIFFIFFPGAEAN